jgi:hypothetical protein
MRTRSEWFQPLALAALLSIGAGVVWGFVSGWAMSVVEEKVNSGNIHEGLVFLHDGTPIIETRTGRNYRFRTFRTLDGKKVEEPDEGFSGSASLLGPAYLDKRFSGLRWRERIVCVANDWYGGEAWYFVHNGERKGHGHFVGYDTKTKAKIGYLGSRGFRGEEPPLDEQFSVDGRRMLAQNLYGGASMLNSNYYNGYGNTKHLLGDDGLWAINLKKRSVEMLRKGTDLLSGASSEFLLLAPKAGAVSPRLPPVPAVLLRTPDRVLTLASDGKELADYPLPPQLRQLTVQWVPLPGKEALASGFCFGHELFWLDNGGKVARHQHFDLVDQGESELMRNAMMSTIIPSPAPIAAFTVCYPWAPAECSESLGYSAALGIAMAKVRPILLATGIVGLVAACACYFRQRKYGLPNTAVWTLFVLLFGLPAYFGYLAHRAWPARMPCPRCGRRVPRDRPACFACGRDFPMPAAKGIELFA